MGWAQDTGSAQGIWGPRAGMGPWGPPLPGVHPTVGNPQIWDRLHRRGVGEGQGVGLWGPGWLRVALGSAGGQVALGAAGGLRAGRYRAL